MRLLSKVSGWTFALLAFAVPARAWAQDDEQLEKQLNADTQASWVINVSDLGDIRLFGGAITVPIERPSVEHCGEWLTVPPEQRRRKIADLQREADDTASKQRFSPKERQELRTKTVSPLKRCEADFKKRCEDTKTKVPIETRKAALVQVRKELAGFVDAKKAGLVKGYLNLILRQCALEE
jgi:hypothetical protein